MKTTAVRLLSLVSLVALASCGGGGGGAGSDSGGKVRGRFVDAPVYGAQYFNTASNSWDITMEDGGFFCDTEKEDKVQFFLGGIKLGSVECKENIIVYPHDLVGENINKFDSSTTSAKISLLLLSVHFTLDTSYGDMYRPENYDSTNFGPESIDIPSHVRTLLADYDESIFGNDEDSKEAFADLINSLRCWGAKGELSTEACSDISEEVYLNDDEESPLYIGRALQGAVIHMEKTIMVNSGIVANPGKNLYAQTIGEDEEDEE